MKYQYDSSKRIKYHPELHPNHKLPFKLADLVYLCKHYKRGDRREISFALGRTEASVASMVSRLKKDGEFDYYKNLNIGDDR